MAAMDPHSSNLQFRVAMIMLLQAMEELKKTKNPLAKEIEQFIEGVVAEREKQ